MSELSVGVAGCGAIATERHIPAIRNNHRTELHSVYDHKFANAERAASQFDVPRAYADFEAFLEPLDLITVAVPPFAHRDHVVPALQSGVHVLCEKPMAVERADAKAMLETASGSDARLGLVHNFLFSHAMRRAKRLVRQGVAGDINYVKGFQISSPSRGLPSWYTELPYDLFFDESPHLLYLMEWFIGSLTPQQVHTQFGDQKLESITATLTGADNQTGQLTMHFDAPLSEWYLVVVGSRRLLIVDVFRDVLYQFDRERSHSANEVLAVSLSAVRQILTGVLKSGIRLLNDDLFFGFDELLDRHVMAIRTGRHLPVSAEDGYRILNSAYEIIEADN